MMNDLFTFIGLTGLEIVLGIDNIVLLTIIVGKLPPEERNLARNLGLGLALLARVIFLICAFWMTKLTAPLLVIMGKSFSSRDLILLFGGLFLLAKASTEIFNFVELQDHQNEAPKPTSFFQALVQIIIFDLIFSLDSVLTAVGLSENIYIMVSSVIVAIIFMILFARKIGDFVQGNPGIKMLALSFLVLIGVLLISEGFGAHFNRGFVYFSMVFSLGIELLNRRRRQKAQT